LPEEHGALKHRVPTPGDYSPGQADVPRAFREYDDDVTADLQNIAPKQIVGGSAGKLLIVDGTGATAFAAMKGDATLAADGTLTIGKEKVTNEKVGKKAIRGENLDDGSVGTSHLGENAVGPNKINDEAVTLSKLAKALNLPESYLADGAVTSRKAKISGGVVEATGDLALGEAYADVPGAFLKLTPGVTMLLRVNAAFDMVANGAPGLALGSIQLDGGATNTRTAKLLCETSGGVTPRLRATVPQVYELVLTGGEAHTVKLRAKREAGGAGYAVAGAGTAFLWTLVAA
jgi:hypothetical protein